MKRKIMSFGWHLLRACFILSLTVQILSSQQTRPGLRYLLYPAISSILIVGTIHSGAYLYYRHVYRLTTTEDPPKPFPWWETLELILILEGIVLLLAGLLFFHGTRW